MQMIRERLFIASRDDLFDVQRLVSQKISQILTVDSIELPEDLKRDLAHHNICVEFFPMLDTADFDMLAILEDALKVLSNRKPCDATVVHW